MSKSLNNGNGRSVKHSSFPLLTPLNLYEQLHARVEEGHRVWPNVIGVQFEINCCHCNQHGKNSVIKPTDLIGGFAFSVKQNQPQEARNGLWGVECGLVHARCQNAPGVATMPIRTEIDRSLEQDDDSDERCHYGAIHLQALLSRLRQKLTDETLRSMRFPELNSKVSSPLDYQVIGRTHEAVVAAIVKKNVFIGIHLISHTERNARHIFQLPVLLGQSVIVLPTMKRPTLPVLADAVSV